MAHFLDLDDTVSSTLVETESLDDLNEHWTPQGFGIMHIFTKQARIKKSLRDLDFDAPFIQKNLENIDMESVVTVIIGVDKKHRKDVMRLDPVDGE